MTHEQALLLRAVHGSDEEARAAWSEWRTTVAWDEIDNDSYYLLPALYRALERRQIADDWYPRLAGVYRKSWYGNHLLRQQTAPAVLALAEAGAPLMLLAAPALVYAYQNDCGLRPLTRLDCLIRREHLTPAESVLAQLGWRSVSPAYSPLRRLWQGPPPASAFARGDSLRLVLHWRRPGLAPALSAQCWANATESDWLAGRIQVPAPPDALRQVSSEALNDTGVRAASDKLMLQQITG